LRDRAADGFNAIRDHGPTHDPDLRVDAVDLNLWKSQFIAPPASDTNVAIPEPAGVLLTALSLIALTSRRSRSKSRATV
jgi:hypothetical protein